ncbi:MAG: hypothetical protein JO084_10985 [Bradyrhizobiaceae bacterium]|nr:hypothetical protein [Bradyrhizobiaceae bacterium]
MIRYTRNLASVAAVVVVMAAGWAAAAQNAEHPVPVRQIKVIPSPLPENSAQSIRIASTRVEVHDKDHFATFLGNVYLVNGDSMLKCNKLRVFYEENSSPAAAPESGQTSSTNQQITRLEAEGDVVLTQKDQSTTGDGAVFDMKAHTAIMTGNVVITPRGEPAR